MSRVIECDLGMEDRTAIVPKQRYSWRSGRSRRFTQPVATDLSVLFARAVVARDSQYVRFTLIACVISATVATFQFAVFTSFLEAAAVLPRLINADAWIVNHDVQSFDFPYPIAEDLSAYALGPLGDLKAERVVFGFAAWNSPRGRRGNVAVVGLEHTGLGPREIVVDRSDMERLDLEKDGDTASIGDLRVTLGGQDRRLATFLGAPYVIVPLETAREILLYPDGMVSFVALRGRVSDVALRAARIRFPELSFYSGDEFQTRSSIYWQSKTGAGMAILLAAVLASVLMAILLSNGISSLIARRKGDLISMMVHGATQEEVFRVIFVAAVLVTTSTLAITLILTPVIDWLSDPILPWVHFKLKDVLCILCVFMISIIATTWRVQRDIKEFPPHAIFRS